MAGSNRSHGNRKTEDHHEERVWIPYPDISVLSISVSVNIRANISSTYSVDKQYLFSDWMGKV